MDDNKKIEVLQQKLENTKQARKQEIINVLKRAEDTKHEKENEYITSISNRLLEVHEQLENAVRLNLELTTRLKQIEEGSIELQVYRITKEETSENQKQLMYDELMQHWKNKNMAFIVDLATKMINWLCDKEEWLVAYDKKVQRIADLEEALKSVLSVFGDDDVRVTEEMYERWLAVLEDRIPVIEEDVTHVN